MFARTHQVQMGYDLAALNLTYPTNLKRLAWHQPEKSEIRTNPHLRVNGLSLAGASSYMCLLCVKKASSQLNIQPRPLSAEPF
jgi:hypothetical protein